MSEEHQGPFTLGDIKAIHYLALALGVVTCGECLVTEHSTPALFSAFGLIVVAGIHDYFRSKNTGAE